MIPNNHTGINTHTHTYTYQHRQTTRYMYITSSMLSPSCHTIFSEYLLNCCGCLCVLFVSYFLIVQLPPDLSPFLCVLDSGHVDNRSTSNSEDLITHCGHLLFEHSAIDKVQTHALSLSLSSFNTGIFSLIRVFKASLFHNASGISC